MMKKPKTDRSGRFDVGYRKPPVASRFKPGLSGNPNGRRRGTKGFAAIFRQISNEKVVVRDVNGVPRKMDGIEAMIRNLRAQAMTGKNPKAFAQYIMLAKECGCLKEKDIRTDLLVRFVRATGSRNKDS